jgi:hypothetical protein
MSDDFGIAFLGFFESRKMSLGNDQHMRGCLRIDVFEREHVRVFMNLLAGDLSANNAAEKAVGAGIAHGAQFLTDRECGQEGPLAGEYRMRLGALVQTHQKHGAFGGFGLRCKLLGPFMIILRHAHANPPIPGRAGKTQDFCGAVAAGEMVRHLTRNLFVRETTDLNGPFFAGAADGGRLHQFNFDLGNTGLLHIYLFGRGKREIDDASSNKGPAVGDADESVGPSLHIRYPHYGAESVSAMCRGHGMHVVDLAVRRAAVVVRRTIPTGESDLAVKRFCVCGNLRLSQISGGGGLRRPFC